MPKLQNPPQAGEKRLCLSIFCTMMTAVMSAVVVIYAIVIVYKPSIIELQSNLQVSLFTNEMKLSGTWVGDLILF